MVLIQRPSRGRLLFYTRDSGGKHETTPGEYVRTARLRAEKEGLEFGGTSDSIERMIASGAAVSGDLFLDFDVKGNQLSRPGLDALMRRLVTDQTVSHVFIPRRDRLARPDHPTDGLQLEVEIRRLGVTIIFMDRVCGPVKLGDRDSLGDMIISLVDYDQAGKDRRVLAEKILFAQLALAKAGHATGGRAPYGFCRWLVSADGQLVRHLADGERVRMAGHHVVWMPVAEDHPHMRTIRRILTMLETLPATRVAAQLTREGVATPDAGRTRKDNGVRHVTSGVWHATTITNIARNKLLLAVASFGRRSMGDQLRFDSVGPRAMKNEDYRADGKPKVIRNSDGAVMTAEAKFDPLVDVARHKKLLETLDRRAGTQRGKARSRDPNRNPLGGRLFDINCTWPMYRVPKQGSYEYKCGAYMQSHGAECDHNKVDGPAITNVALDALRQKLLKPTAIEKLKAKLRRLAEEEHQVDSSAMDVATKEHELRQAEQALAKVQRNLAMAESPEQYKAVAEVFDDLQGRSKAIRTELLALQRKAGCGTDIDEEVNAALAVFDRLPELAGNDQDLTAVTQAFQTVNVRVFLGFRQEQLKKRTVNRVRHGKITFGGEEPPIAIYAGPTGRRALNGTTTAAVAVSPGGDPTLPGPM